MSTRNRGPPASVKEQNSITPSNAATCGDLENPCSIQPPTTFPVSKIRDIIKEILHNRLDSFSYNSTSLPALATEVASTVRDKVKEIYCSRYKIVAFVTITENKHPSIKLVSRCVWNENHDRFVDYAYKNGKLHASAIVYGIYQE